MNGYSILNALPFFSVENSTKKKKNEQMNRTYSAWFKSIFCVLLLAFIVCYDCDQNELWQLENYLMQRLILLNSFNSGKFAGVDKMPKLKLRELAKPFFGHESSPSSSLCISWQNLYAEMVLDSLIWNCMSQSHLTLTKMKLYYVLDGRVNQKNHSHFQCMYSFCFEF